MTDFKLVKALLKGTLTYIPGINSILRNKKSEHSCSDSFFCYNLWLRILVHLHQNGEGHRFCRIGEIGNGGSLGVGLCALLSGSEEYYSFEIKEYSSPELNIKLLDELIILFKNKTPISKKLRININVNNLGFPEELIDHKYLDISYIEELRNDLLSASQKKIHIINNWYNYSSLNLDLIYSRAVLEHVFDPSVVYKSAVNNLSQNRIMLHDIELHSHGVTTDPDGHYNIPEKLWRIIFGKREYYLNRWTYEDHKSEILKQNCSIIATSLHYVQSNKKNNVLTGVSILAKKTFE